MPWCTTQNFSVRCTAIAALKVLWSQYKNYLAKKENIISLSNKINDFFDFDKSIEEPKNKELFFIKQIVDFDVDLLAG